MNDRQVIAQITVPEDMAVSVRATIPKYLKGKDYLRVFSDGMACLAKDKEINLTDLRVFIGLLPHVGYENVIEVAQSVLAEELGIVQQEVSKSIKKLVDKGYLEAYGQKKRQKIYRLNSHVGVKCRAGHVHRLQGEQVPVKVPD
jgi:predicted transcriptional regulator